MKSRLGRESGAASRASAGQTGGTGGNDELMQKIKELQEKEAFVNSQLGKFAQQTGQTSMKAPPNV